MADKIYVLFEEHYHDGIYYVDAFTTLEAAEKRKAAIEVLVEKYRASPDWDIKTPIQDEAKALNASLFADEWSIEEKTLHE